MSPNNWWFNRGSTNNTGRKTAKLRAEIYHTTRCTSCSHRYIPPIPPIPGPSVDRGSNTHLGTQYSMDAFWHTQTSSLKISQLHSSLLPSLHIHFPLLPSALLSPTPHITIYIPPCEYNCVLPRIHYVAMCQTFVLLHTDNTQRLGQQSPFEALWPTTPERATWLKSRGSCLLIRAMATRKDYHMSNWQCWLFNALNTPDKGKMTDSLFSVT